jgi:hypothetical protein
MIDIEQLELMYFQNDEPCPYKLKCGYELKIKPISVKDWSIFSKSLEILQLHKNEINDIQVIQMSYLEYLVRVVLPCDNENLQYSQRLSKLFQYSMGENDVRVTKDKDKICLILIENDIIKAKITSKEFDEISKIVLFQNLKDYDNNEMSADIRQMIQDYYEVKYKNSYTPNLEQQKTFVISKTGILMKDINEMTYRTFSQVYQNCLRSELYIGDKIIQGSYKYDVKEVVVHPLLEKPKNIIDEVFKTTDDKIKNKINKING